LQLKTWKTVIKTEKRALKAGILYSNLKFRVFLASAPSQLIFLNVFDSKGLTTEKKNCHQKRNSRNSLNYKIPAFSARLSALITFFQVKKHKKN
jgi:hypothetical protein